MPEHATQEPRLTLLPFFLLLRLLSVATSGREPLVPESSQLNHSFSGMFETRKLLGRTVTVIMSYHKGASTRAEENYRRAHQALPRPGSGPRRTDLSLYWRSEGRRVSAHLVLEREWGLPSALPTAIVTFAC